MAKPPIIQYWHEPDPPDYICELLDSFAAQNPDMEHMVFDEATARELIAAHCGPREAAAFDACALPAMQADYFRYCAGHALGGICVDADCRCVAPLLPLFSGLSPGVLVEARPAVLANGLFWFRSPGSLLLEIVREIATQLALRRFAATAPVVTGPGLFTCLYCMHRVGSLDTALRYANEGAGQGGRAEHDDPTVGQLESLFDIDPPRSRALIGVAAAVVADDDRLKRAFEGVRVMSGAELSPRRIHHVGGMQYKSTDSHWSSPANAIPRGACQ